MQFSPAMRMPRRNYKKLPNCYWLTFGRASRNWPTSIDAKNRGATKVRIWASGPRFVRAPMNFHRVNEPCHRRRQADYAAAQQQTTALITWRRKPQEQNPQQIDSVPQKSLIVAEK